MATEEDFTKKRRLEKQDKQNYSTLPRIFLRFFIYQLQKVLSKNRIGTPPRVGRKTLDPKKKGPSFRPFCLRTTFEPGEFSEYFCFSLL